MIFGLSLATGAARGTPALQFTAQNYTPAGDQRYAALGDLNGDGKTGLLLASPFANTVSVILNRGDGTYIPGATYSVGLYPCAILIGDFNNDGKPDALVVNGNDNSLSFLRAHGDGTFDNPTNAPVALPLAGGYIWAVAGDFNRDGNLDLVVAVSHGWGCTLSLLPGNGDGSFAAPQSFDSLPSQVNGLATADLNHDGNPDLLTANWNAGINSSQGIGVLLGNGDGTFQSDSWYPVSADPNGAPIAFSLGDIDGDGRLDLLVTLYGPSPGYAVLRGHGDGSFEPAQEQTTSDHIQYAILGDFDGDGRLDFVTAGEFTNAVFVLPGQGNGSFGDMVAFPVSDVRFCLLSGDVNGDGRPDLIAEGFGTLSVLLNQTAAAAPRLQLGPLIGGQVKLTWPAFGTTAFRLESTTNCVAAESWVAVTNAPTTENGQKVLTLPTTDPARYYRLRAPSP